MHIMMRTFLLATTLLHACGGGEPQTGSTGGNGGNDGGGGNGGGGGGGSGGSGGAGGAPSGRYQPMKVGATWTYRITSMGASSNKTSTVEAFEDMGGAKAGTMGFKVRTEKLSGYTVGWRQDLGDKVVVHREQAWDATGLTNEDIYEPYRLRVDESAAHTAMGVTWMEMYSQIKTGSPAAPKTNTWTVEAVNEPVTVPAGTFNCLRVRRTSGPMSNKIYWFARGVGKVKEEGGQLEELVSYSIP